MGEEHIKIYPGALRQIVTNFTSLCDLPFSKAKVTDSYSNSLSLNRRAHVTATIHDHDITAGLRGLFESYAKEFDISVDLSEDYRAFVTRYSGSDAGNFALHTDTIFGHSVIRKITLIALLDDDYQGGDLMVLGKQRDLSPGDIIMFPAIYPHEVKMVTKGVRHSLVAWCLGPAWR
jgi:hypothetical protein